MGETHMRQSQQKEEKSEDDNETTNSGRDASGEMGGGKGNRLYLPFRLSFGTYFVSN